MTSQNDPDEKQLEVSLEHLEGLEAREEHPDITAFSLEERKKIIRRIDWRLLPIVGLMYCISLMDRTNLGNANIAGMSKEFHLDKGMRYSIITLVFFPTYIVFELPSIVLIRRIGPRILLSFITFSWGLILIGFGKSNGWKTLAGLRTLLGVLEAGFFPGSMYLLSTWYTRYEMHQRFSIWYFVGTFANSLSGILAYGLIQMNGLQGLGGWRWIFIIEGVLTCVVGLIGYIFLIGFPDGKQKAFRFLNDKETRFVIARINADRGDAEESEKFGWLRLLSHALDLKIWGFAFIFCMVAILAYSLAYFLPNILQGGMGFEGGIAQLLIAPPYFVAGLYMCLVGWLGDKYKAKALIIFVNCALAITGLSLMGYCDIVGVRYFGAFLTAMGGNAQLPTSISYQANNIRGHLKRQLSSAAFVGMGGVGGIIGSLVFRSQDAPRYRPGLLACIVAQCLIVLITCALSAKFLHDNRRQALGRLVIEGQPGFRYTI